ncbi:hypothetical protein BDZ85DRAFT_24303 [Elsinoe ampelina]|uniref:Uncharacterized protein n=1 Tax=Elsinoe ampelina TaxID=302913 RepID=A0A6A6G6B6_9PEZI|nr:hypothetical protein BDZ85DRAFT_24303 [Elsinoe ampelina]
MKRPGNQSKRKFDEAESTDDDENGSAAPAKKPKKSAQDVDNDSEVMKVLDLIERHNQRAASKIAAAKKVLLKNERRAKPGGDDKLKEENQQLKRDLAASEKRNKALEGGIQVLGCGKDDKLEAWRGGGEATDEEQSGTVGAAPPEGGRVQEARGEICQGGAGIGGGEARPRWLQGAARSPSRSHAIGQTGAELMIASRLGWRPR